MNRKLSGLWPALLGLGLLAPLGLTLTARQDPPVAQPAGPAQVAIPVARGASVQDALNRPFHFPFGKPTPLEEAAAHLSKALNAPVALDRAALDRLELKPDDPVQLELDGVRLKTGLKLLLDQLDLTFKIVPEDNLLIITDPEGSSEPLDSVLQEIKALHREVHDVQDRLDDLRAGLGLDGEPGAKFHKPTILEEVPGPKADKAEEPHEAAPGLTRPGSRKRSG